MINLIILQDTYAKKSTEDSSKLSADQKTKFSQGWSGNVKKLNELDNHSFLRLPYGAGDWWFFNPHIAFQNQSNPDQLTKNFHLSELTVSQTASRQGLDNTPGKKEKANLKLLCEKVLQPVRDHYNLPLIVTSGYRSPEVNRAVGGSSSSQHMSGQAADFTVPGIDNYSLAIWIRDNLNYDQLILEFYTGGNSGWIHLGYSTRQLNQELTINSYGTFSGLKRY